MTNKNLILTSLLIGIASVSCSILSDPIQSTGNTVQPQGNNPDSATVASSLGPLTFKVLDAEGNPKSDVSLFFALKNLTGLLDPMIVTSDAEGMVQLMITLGNRATQGKLLISGVGVTPVELPLAALAGKPTALLPDGAGWTLYKLGESSSLLLRVRLLDSFSNPVSGSWVEFTPTANSITLSQYKVQTDAQGIATTQIAALEAPPGQYLVHARADSNDPNTPLQTDLLLNITAADAASLTFLTQEPIANTLCNGYLNSNSNTNAPLWVQVKDSFGSPIAGATVHFSSTNNLLLLQPNSDLSDALGRASTVVSSLNTTALTSLTIQATIAETNLSADCPITILP